MPYQLPCIHPGCPGCSRAAVGLALGTRRGHYVVVRFGSSVSAVLVGGTLAALLSGLAACGQSTEPCAGQCGPPFQLQVTFRSGISAQAAAAAMSNCASKPFVVRIGSVTRAPGSPAPLTATVYTEAMRGHQTDRLLARTCLILIDR